VLIVGSVADILPAQCTVLTPGQPKETPSVETLNQDEELKAHLLATNEHFRSLAEQHARLKHQIEEIEAKPHVTGADEIEEQRLKKLKLHLKDEMNQILARHKTADVR